MSVTLQQLLEGARHTLERDRSRVSASDLRARLREARLVGRAPGRLRQALRGPDLTVIAEVKGASPVDGTLRAQLEPAAVAAAYADAGATAISVLTEERWFAGSLDHLRAVTGRVPVPVLRKDFIVDRYQVEAAALAGAAAILLIVEALDDAALRELVEAAHEVGLDALVEAHDARGIERGARAGSGLLGINNRDLDSMRVDWEHCLRVADQLPDGTVCVAESGIGSADQLRRIRAAGYDAVLIGSSLMRAPDPGAALRTLLGRGN